MAEGKMIRIAIAGNPNCGKTTLFNTLTGSNQFVGNWPGVTVEKKEGTLRGHDGVIVTDLPGIYSLSPYTPEEIVARKYLVNERPEAILNIVDGTNIERNLYLTTQLLELGIPVVVAINMMDVVRRNGDNINIEALSRELGAPVVEISALKGDGVDEAIELAVRTASEGKYRLRHIFSGTVEHAIAHIEEACVHSLPDEEQRWYAIKLFERDTRVHERLDLGEERLSHIEKDIADVENELDDDAESIIANERYVYITGLVARVYKRKNENGLTTSDKIDNVLTNRWLALPIFALIMFLVYYISVTTVGTWAVDFTNDVLFGKWIMPTLDFAFERMQVAPWLSGLVTDGIVGGVGSVLSFVPQMFVLFFLLSFLEASGYMSRIAFVMDKLFRKFGLSGKSFIPILIGTGCSVPGIMASRTIENESDRRMTVITTSFIPCGAKLPVIALVSSVLFGGAWYVAPLAYFVGIAAIVVSGIILKKTKMFDGDVAPFVMELPAYHMPTVRNLWLATWERGWSFIKKAGTIILLSSVVLWSLQNLGFVGGAFGFVGGENIDRSLLAYIGNSFAFVFKPLGFGHWQEAVAVVTGLIAKENIAATFGVIYGVNNMGSLTALSGFSFLVFNLLCAPCFAAIGAIRREMNSAKWTLFAIGYQTVLAYSVSLVIYQLGMAISGNANAIGLAVALAVLGFGVYMLLREKRNGGVKK